MHSDRGLIQRDRPALLTELQHLEYSVGKRSVLSANQAVRDVLICEGLELGEKNSLVSFIHLLFKVISAFGTRNLLLHQIIALRLLL